MPERQAPPPIKRSPHSRPAVLVDAFFWLLPWILTLISSLAPARQSGLFNLDGIYAALKILVVAAIVVAAPHIMLTRALADSVFSQQSNRPSRTNYRYACALLALVLFVSLFGWGLWQFFMPSGPMNLELKWLFISAILYWFLIPLLSFSRFSLSSSVFILIFGSIVLLIASRSAPLFSVSLTLMLVNALMGFRWLAPRLTQERLDASMPPAPTIPLALLLTGPLFSLAWWSPSIIQWLSVQGNSDLDVMKATAICVGLPLLFSAIQNMEHRCGDHLNAFYSILSGADTSVSALLDIEQTLPRQLLQTLLPRFVVTMLTLQSALACLMFWFFPDVGDLLSLSLWGTSLFVSAFVVTILFHFGAYRETWVLGFGCVVFQSLLFVVQCDPLWPSLTTSLIATGFAILLLKRRLHALFYFAFLPK